MTRYVTETRALDDSTKLYDNLHFLSAIQIIQDT